MVNHSIPDVHPFPKYRRYCRDFQQEQAYSFAEIDFKEILGAHSPRFAMCISDCQLKNSWVRSEYSVVYASRTPLLFQSVSCRRWICTGAMRRAGGSFNFEVAGGQTIVTIAQKKLSKTLKAPPIEKRQHKEVYLQTQRTKSAPGTDPVQALDLGGSPSQTPQSGRPG
jgi:hypothetical protein